MRPQHSRWLPFVASAALVLAVSEPALAAASPAPPAGPPAPGKPAGAAIDPKNLLLFSVDLQGLTLTDGLGAYGAENDPLLPVGELARLLEMDVDVLPADRRIEGRIGEARRALLVDLNTSTARIGPKEVALTPADVAVTPTEIYMRASAMEKLFPLKLAVKPDDLQISITATEPLPIQERMQRMANRPSGAPRGGPDQPALEVDTPYRLFTPPSADVNLGVGAQSQKPQEPLRYDLRLAGDLFYSNFQAFLSSDENGQPTSARFLLDRRSLGGGLLGPLHAREISLGDTFTPALAIGPRGVAGRGVAFSTAPLTQTNVFNRIDLRGELPLGYDVELYINDVLVASQNTPNDGRYEFLNVPLTPGVNVVRTVLYGPRGERTEQTRVINVGGGLLQRGDATFDFGAVEQDVPLFKLGTQNDNSIDPTITHIGGLRIVGSFNYGVTNFLTLSAGAAVLPPMSDQPSRNPRGVDSTAVSTVGARTSILGLATQVDAAVDSHHGRAESVSLAGSYRGVSAVLRHAEYQNGFVDENNLGADLSLTLERRTELTTDTSLHLRGQIIPVSLRIVRNGYVNGGSDLLAAWRASSSIGSILYSTGFEYDRYDYRPARPTQKLTGYLAASTFQNFSWQLRATLDFDLLPVAKADLLSITADHALSENWALRFTLGEPLDNPSATIFTVSSIYHSHVGDLSLTADYDNGQHSWQLQAGLNFGIGYNPWLHGYELTPAGPGSGGSAVLDAYFDTNGDGVREPGEPPAPNVLIEGGGAKRVATGPNGRAYITGLGAAPVEQLSVNLDKVDDTSVKTPPTSIRISPRPGGVARINFPMQPTGGVTVMVELQRDDGKLVGLSSVKVDLAPEHGKPIEQTTEFDGSAVFDEVPIGTYRVQLDPKQAERLRMHLLSSPTVVIKADGSFTPDAKVQVKFDPPSASAPSKSSAG